jgi:predicted RNase H-like nuclease (RuvC/YqgF family)
MKKLNIDKLITEESKRFMRISEYSFYGVNEAEDDELDAELKDLESELPPADDAETETETPAEEPMDDMGSEEGTFGEEEPVDDMGGDEVEVDVTDLVNTSNELKTSSEENSAKMAELIDNFNKLASQVNTMTQMTKKIDSLDNELKTMSAEIQKRNPTPTEKIEMRSLDSFPYNIKLSDFWSDHSDKVTTVASSQSNIGEEKPKEYVLTKADVDDFSNSDIRDSFGDFEEEDIY